jgi:hypothetical protein
VDQFALAIHDSVHDSGGGAAYLISKSIKAARLVAFEDFGMEAIYEFEVQDMPVIMAVEVEGRSIHNAGPAAWRQHASRRANSPVDRIRVCVSPHVYLNARWRQYANCIGRNTPGK